MSKNDGGPAFPIPPTWTPEGNGYHSGNEGASLRDYFAGKALQGILARSLTQDDGYDLNQIRLISDRAFEYADAMLEARNK